MGANASKCGVTGILYRTCASMNDNPLCAKSVEMVRRRLQHITLQGQVIPFKHPDNDPYDYLGVPMTASLNYKYYHKGLLAKLKEKTTMLSASFASGTQRLQVLKRCIIPGITYAFPIMPLAMHDLNKCDSLIAKCAKKACGVANYAPNALVHKHIKDGGMGVLSIRTQYYQLK